MNYKILIVLFLSSIVFSSSAKLKKVLTFVYEDYPPYEYSTESGISGVSADRVRKIANELGYTPRFILAPWTRAISLVKKGGVDGIFSLNRSPDREKYLTFTKYPIAWSEERLFSLKGKVKSIDFFNDISKHSVGVVSGYSYGKAFDELIIPRKEIYKENRGLVVRLDSGKIDVIVMNQNVFDHHVSSMKLDRTRFVMHPLVVNGEDLFLGFSKKNPAAIKAAEGFSRLLKDIKLNKPR